jgi:hypothetical protein
MKTEKIIRWSMVIALLAMCLGSQIVAQSAETNINGIVEYIYEWNPQEIKPKMYNWEVMLSAADSRNGTYEIVQITKPVKADSKAAGSAPNVLIESKVITLNQDGIIDFKLYVGDKEPKQNMGRRGNIGQPIVFSGRGTGNAASNWIVLPGTKVDRVVPFGKGTQLSDGRLSLIQFIVTNDSGEKFQADVILRRK